MKKIFIFIIFSLLFNLSFADNLSDWAKDSVIKLKELNIIDNRFEGRYREKIKRIEFAYLSVNLYEKISNKTIAKSERTFIDTDDDFILKARNQNIANGYPDNTFKPLNNITREELAVLIMNVVRATNKNYDKEIEYILKFSDDDKIAKWAYEDVYFTRKNKIVNGIGENFFSGKSNATIEEAIVMIKRAYDLLSTLEENSNLDDNKFVENSNTNNNHNDKFDIMVDKKNSSGKYSDLISKKIETIDIKDINSKNISIKNNYCILIVDTSKEFMIVPMENILKISKLYLDKNFIIVDVNSNVNDDLLKYYKEYSSKNVSIILDRNNEFYFKNNYKIDSYPTFLFINKENIIIDVQVGDLSLKSLFDKLLINF